MTAALTLMVIFAVSFTLVRLASVALRLTGMSDGQARFQALSALTGTGFTTTEAELVVNYPIRRKIISNLMIIGNLGLVSVVSTLMISFLRTDANVNSVLIQLAWILSGIGALCLLMLNPAVDRVVCGAIAVMLRKFTFLGKRRYTRLIQLGGELSIAEHQIGNAEHKSIEDFLGEASDLTCLAVKLSDGTMSRTFSMSQTLGAGDSCIIIGDDQAHDRLAQNRPEAV